MGEEQHDLRFYLAAERTYLAWIRTGVALMGFGFVVARFGLLLREIEFMQVPVHIPEQGLSVWFGSGLMALGVALNIAATIQHVRLIRKMHRGEAGAQPPSALGITAALLLAAGGIVMTVYLIAVR